MTTIVETVKDLLVTAGVGTWKATSGWNITIGKLPASPDTAAAIMLSGGQPPNPRYLLDFPSLQVLVRGDTNGYVVGYQKAQLVKDTLLGLPSQTIGTNRWVGVNMIGDILPIGFDEKDRPMFSINFQCIIEPQTGTNRQAL